jgi:hypothetical protein
MIKHHHIGCLGLKSRALSVVNLAHQCVAGVYVHNARVEVMTDAVDVRAGKHNPLAPRVHTLRIY